MTAQVPLYINSLNELQRMTPAHVSVIAENAGYQYALNPSATLEVVGNAGVDSIGDMVDTRKTAGSATSTQGGYASEAATPDIGTTSTIYSTVRQVNQSVSQPTSTTKTFPVYVNALNELQCMTETDFIDTFISPAFSGMASTTNYRGAYTVFAGNVTIPGYVQVSSQPIFTDTRANPAAYTQGGIPEALDQPVTIQSYYLYLYGGLVPSGSSDYSSTLPIYADADNNLRRYTKAEFDTLLSNYVRYAAVGVAGQQLNYSISTGVTTNIRGTGMADTTLDGTSAEGYTQGTYGYSGGGNYYSTQEFPTGSPTTNNTYYLKLTKS